MNIYDTKMVICANCKKSISKVDFNAMIIHPLYGQCANPMPEGDGTLHTTRWYQNKSLKVSCPA